MHRGQDSERFGNEEWKFRGPKLLPISAGPSDHLTCGYNLHVVVNPSTRTSPRGMVGAEALSTNPNPNQTCLESEILQVATLQVQKSKSDFRVPNRMETIKPHPGRSLPVPNTLSDLQNTRNHLAQRPDFWRSSGVVHSSLGTGSTSSRGSTSKNVFFCGLSIPSHS